jgi:hypothetical protein
VACIARRGGSSKNKRIYIDNKKKEKKKREMEERENEVRL